MEMDATVKVHVYNLSKMKTLHNINNMLGKSGGVYHVAVEICEDVRRRQITLVTQSLH